VKKVNSRYLREEADTDKEEKEGREKFQEKITHRLLNSLICTVHMYLINQVAIISYCLHCTREHEEVDDQDTNLISQWIPCTYVYDETKIA
jgi:hypothetical protein